MTVTLNKRQLGRSAVELVFSSAAPPPVTFTVYRNSIPILETLGTTARVSAVDGDVFEVVDDGSPSKTPNGSALIRWPASPGASEYVVEKFDGSWAEFATLPDDGSAEFSVPVVADDADTSFRVTAKNKLGGASAAVVVNVRAERHPPALACKFAFNAGANTVTITEL
jgi:hypothetical protein